MSLKQSGEVERFNHKLKLNLFKVVMCGGKALVLLKVFSEYFFTKYISIKITADTGTWMESCMSKPVFTCVY